MEMVLRRVALAYSGFAQGHKPNGPWDRDLVGCQKTFGEILISDPRFQTARLFGRDGSRERHVHSMDAVALEHYRTDYRTTEQTKLGV